MQQEHIDLARAGAWTLIALACGVFLWAMAYLWMPAIKLWWWKRKRRHASKPVKPWWNEPGEGGR